METDPSVELCAGGQQIERRTAGSCRVAGALVAGIGIQLGMQSLVAGAVVASPPSGYADTDGGEGGFDGAGYDGALGGGFEPDHFFGGGDDDDGRFESAAAVRIVETNYFESSKAEVPSIGKVEEAVTHSYDEFGINVLTADADGFVSISGTAADDVVTVSDTPYNRQIVVNGYMYYAPTTPGVGVIVDGAEGDDVITGSPDRDRLFGGDGNDTVYGGTGSDLIVGGEGDDHLFGHGGADTILGNDGDDVIFPGRGDDNVIGGWGDDTIDEVRHNSDWWMFAGTNRLNGGPGDDVIRGGAARDLLNGGDGDDTLEGGAGKDTLNGDAGDDVLYGGPGGDLINGHDGNDYADGGSGGDRVRGHAGDDIVSGGSGIDIVDGGDGNDVLIAGPGVSWIIAAREIDGGDGNKDIEDQGTDTIYSAGRDRIELSDNDVLVDVPNGYDLAEHQIEIISPNSHFEDRVNSDLVTLGSIPSQGLLASIQQADKAVRIFEAEDPRGSSFAAGAEGGPTFEEFLKPDGSPGAGIGTDIVYGTAKPRRGSAAELPIVQLVHELVHASNNANGIVDRGFSVELGSDGQPLTDLNTGEFVITADRDLQATGLRYDKDGNQFGLDLYPAMPDDLEPNTMPFTENSLRAELNLDPRENYRTRSDPLANSEPSRVVRYEDLGIGGNKAGLLRKTTSSSGHPSCEGGAESDSDGDGYGWENSKTCVR